MHHLSRSKPLALLAAACLIAGPAFAAEPKVDDLLSKMPAQSVAEGQQLAAELLRRGPAAIRAVCAKVIDPAQGGDLKANAQARYLLHGLATYCSRPDAAAERKACTRALLDVMAGEKRPEVKKFLIRQLQLAGTDDAVPALAKLLGDDAYAEPATQALLAIRTPAANGALLKALPAARGARRVALIRALGRRRVQAAAPQILKDAASQDTTARLVALYALANIGDPAAASVLAKAADAKPLFERNKATSFYLLFARRLAEDGRKNDCAAICRGLIKSRTAPRERHVVSAALDTLVKGLGAEALTDLMAAVDSPDKFIRAAALRLSDSLAGEAVTTQLTQRLKQAAPPVRVELVETLGRRGDRTALPAVLDAMNDADKTVRIAAVAAAARLGGKDVLAPLLAKLDTAQGDEGKAVQRAIVALPGDEVSATIAKAVPTASVPARAALLDILAGRQAKAHLDTVVKATGDKDAGVRVAAISAMGVLADAAAMPQLVELLLGAESNRERTAALRVLVGLASKIGDAETRADPVLAALGASQGEKRARLLQALSRIGGKKALAAIVTDTKSADAPVQDGAIRALADWQDAGAAPELLNIVRGAQKLPHQVIALRGYVRIVGAAKLSAGQKIRMYKDALAAAKRPQEKKLVLGGLGGVRAPGSVKAVAAYLDDKDLAEDAAATIVRIACPQRRRDKGLRGPDVAAALQKVVAVTKNPALRKKAKEHLKTLKKK